jgi:hypothetical protein
LEIRFINRVERHPINSRLLLIPRQALLGTRLLTQFVVLKFLLSRILVQRNPILIELVPQAINVLHHVMKFGVVLDPFLRTSPQLIDKQGMSIRPLRISRLRYLVVGKGVL